MDVVKVWFNNEERVGKVLAQGTETIFVQLTRTKEILTVVYDPIKKCYIPK